MPYTVNGVGTWYYGQGNPHQLQGTCEFCKRVGPLSSYDTTLFFVVVFVPLIPLARKRILHQCSYCRQHRVIALKQWRAARETDAAGVLDELRRDSADRVAALRGIMLAASYQDEALLNEIVEATARTRQRDAAFQAQLGDTYSFFASWPRAEEAYRAALALDNTENVREALAWVLLQQARVDEARPHVEHVLAARKGPSAYLIFHLISGYQAEGRHDEALDLMDARDRAFPEQAALKECNRQRKTSTRYQGTPKKIRGVALTDGGQGYSRRWPTWMPYAIAASVVIGGVLVYLTAAIALGLTRTVHLVNGTRSPYTVQVNGEEIVLTPGKAESIRVGEGDVEVQFADPALALPPLHADIETLFWTRPFSRYTFILNPDQTAVIVQEQAHYTAKHPPPGPPPVLHIGRSFYQLSGIDYEFEPFPPTLSVESGQTVTKSRVGLAAVTEEARLNLLTQQVPAQEQAQLLERALRFDPGNSQVLYALAARLAPGPMLQILEPRLDDRPIRVEWHRTYQNLIERTEPGTDLRPRYVKLLAATNEHADALYLLGRIEPDPDRAEELFRRAASANPPSGHGFYGLGYNTLSEGRFREAAAAMESGLKLLPDHALCRHFYSEALLAAQQYDRLQQYWQSAQQTPGRRFEAQVELCRLHAIRGNKAEARQALDQAVRHAGPTQSEAVRTALESSLCCWENDVDGYLKCAPAGAFEAAFLRGQLQQAADLVPPGGPDAGALHGLVYLQAKRSGDKERAQLHWQALLGQLRSDGRAERRFAAALEQRQLAGDFPWRRLAIDPQSKRVLLAVLAESHPAQAKDMVALAAKLNYQRDALSFCLDKVLPGITR